MRIATNSSAKNCTCGFRFHIEAIKNASEKIVTGNHTIKAPGPNVP